VLRQSRYLWRPTFVLAESRTERDLAGLELDPQPLTRDVSPPSHTKAVVRELDQVHKSCLGAGGRGIRSAKAYLGHIAWSSTCWTLAGYEDQSHEIKQTLNSYATILSECARDELGGDFTIFPRLRKRVADAMKGAVLLDTGVDPDELIEHLNSKRGLLARTTKLDGWTPSLPLRVLYRGAS